MMPRRSRSDGPFIFDFAAAATGAAVVLLSFGVFHTVWIVNVPTVFVEGIPHALVVALVLAWAIRVTYRTGRIARSPRAGLMLGFLLWLTLVPYEIAGVMWGPWVLPTRVSEGLALSWITLLGAPVGAAIGWTLARTGKAVLAWALVALTVNVMLGGSIAFFGGRGRMFGLFVWLLPTYLLAGLALVWTRMFLHRRARSGSLLDSGR